jgi:hypothetical protein
MTQPFTTTAIGLSAVIFIADGSDPSVLVRADQEAGAPGLPFGSFDPEKHRTFEIALRNFVLEQTGAELDYIEQLYTFGDRGREAPIAKLIGFPQARIISVGYLALATEALSAPGGRWLSWYECFPWEDHRAGRPGFIDREIAPALCAFCDEAQSTEEMRLRRNRVENCFAFQSREWNDERVLDRYELLYEAHLVSERVMDWGGKLRAELPGRSLLSDHRRILATAISRLRAKIRYRPVIFDLMPGRFTLSHLQASVEAVLGQPLHKQNFRRALIRSGFVRDTGVIDPATGGRPAQLFARSGASSFNDQHSGIPTPRLREFSQ